MSTSAILPPGASLLSISGKRCTAIPRTDAGFLSSLLASDIPFVSIALSTSSTTPAVTTPPPAAASTTSTSSAAAAKSTSTVASAPAVAAVPAAANPAAAVSPAPQPTTSSSTTPVQASPTPQAASPSTSTTSSTSITSSSIPSAVSSAPSALSVLSSETSSIPSIVPSTSSLLSSQSSFASSPLPSSASVIASSPSSNLIPVANVQPATTPVIVASTSSAETVAAKTTSSTSSTFAIAQSDSSPVATSTNDDTLSGTEATTTSSPVALPSSSAAAQSSPAVAAASSGSKTAVGPMVGGVLGGFAFIGIVGFFLWFLRRRKRRRDSFLTPLGSEPGDISRRSSTGPGSQNSENASPFEKLKSQVGSRFIVVSSSLSNLKDRVRGDRKNNVNMDRGNSQFMERIPQHSRQNSALSGQTKLTRRERFGDWFERVKEDFLFNMRVKNPGKEKEQTGSFGAVREKEALTRQNTTNPDFSQLLAMEERELQAAAESRRLSLAKGTGLGMNSDPFSDPVRPLQIQKVNKVNPFADPTNPFNDPGNVVSAPKPSAAPSSVYSTDVRRSRGQSIAPTIASRYPSSYAPDRDTYGYRDTYMSSATNGRKNKGRSDPFDLEKLQLEARNESMASDKNSMYMNGYNNPGMSGDRQPRVISAAISESSDTGTYSSKYSSGVSSVGLGEWGDPGPDLGSKSSTNLGSQHPREDSSTFGGLERSGTIGSTGSGKSVGKAI